jgi:NDP-sugar pyrophosphorylase family protein
MLARPDVVILCGGDGVRLRSVTGCGPKSLAAVAGRPFLDLLFRQLRRHAFERVILAVGYRQDMIRSKFGGCAFGLRLEYSEEASPLGTGGALRNASELIESDHCLVMNGDSYTDARIDAFVAEHFRLAADASLIGSPPDDRADCGWMLADEDGRLVRFDEKNARRGSRYLNAGIYMIAKNLLSGMQSGARISLEKEALPRWLAEGKDIRVFADPARCIDIGTPERYWDGQRLLAELGRDQ